MILAGFNQKTAKGELFVKRNYRISSWKLRGKVPKDSRRLSTEARLDPLPCGAGRPVGHPCQPPVVMSVLHRLLGCISAVLSSRFDPRVED
jgi:hypothetical protein